MNLDSYSVLACLVDQPFLVDYVEDCLDVMSNYERNHNQNSLSSNKSQSLRRPPKYKKPDAQPSERKEVESMGDHNVKKI